MMMTEIRLGDIVADVVLKDIKNVHLSVYPPSGRVRISAPRRMKIDTIRVFALSKLAWIKRQQKQIRAQERETPRDYVDRESHYVWGRRYLMQVGETEGAPSVELRHSRMSLRVRPGTGDEKKQEIVERWYRQELKRAVVPLITKWEPVIGVRVQRFFVQRMKTRWGSCSPSRLSIRLNTELAKKPKECLEYIVVHELVHLIEPTHNQRFASLMNKFMPQWRHVRQRLNQLPVRHEDWDY